MAIKFLYIMDKYKKGRKLPSFDFNCYIDAYTLCNDIVYKDGVKVWQQGGKYEMGTYKEKD